MRLGRLRPVLWIAGLITGLAVAITFGVYDDVPTRLVIIGALLAVLVAIVTDLLVTLDRRISSIEELSSRVSGNPDLRAFYDSTIIPLETTYKNGDRAFRRLVQQKLREALAPLGSDWSEWKLSYKGELWRNAYRQVLDEEDVREYKSIAWVKSVEYWQDAPGKEALTYNHVLAKRKRIRRIYLVRDAVWDSPEVKAMIKGDQSAGIVVKVARESAVPEELKHDLGIYGMRAVGYQFTDNRSRTDHFDLHFNPEQIEIAGTRFDNLERWSLSAEELLAYVGSPTTPDDKTQSKAIANS